MSIDVGLTHIDALDFFAQLANETVFNYTAEEKSLPLIVDDLLAFQVHDVPITAGTIDFIDDWTIDIPQDSILGALLRLREQVGGFMLVDDAHIFYWLTDIGEDTGQQIRYEKNMKDIKRTIDYSNMANRIYAYGGPGIVLPPPGYVEDTDAQDLHGFSARRLIDKSIIDQATLIAWANKNLDERKNPLISYRLNIANLANEGLEFEHLELGNIVRVIDNDLSIDESLRIVKIIRDLSDPINITIEVGNKTPDIIPSLGKDERWRSISY